jgi:hypothetical protein
VSVDFAVVGKLAPNSSQAAPLLSHVKPKLSNALIRDVVIADGLFSRRSVYCVLCFATQFPNLLFSRKRSGTFPIRGRNPLYRRLPWLLAEMKPKRPTALWSLVLVSARASMAWSSTVLVASQHLTPFSYVHSYRRSDRTCVSCVGVGRIRTRRCSSLCGASLTASIIILARSRKGV